MNATLNAASNPAHFTLAAAYSTARKQLRLASNRLVELSEDGAVDGDIDDAIVEEARRFEAAEKARIACIRAGMQVPSVHES